MSDPILEDRSSVDIFICHASEDKEAVARPLSRSLQVRGLKVWLDEYEISLGDSLLDVISNGLAAARFGVVILSPAFLAKEWPRRELNALFARETLNGQKVLLPVWHDVSPEEISRLFPLISDRMAVSTDKEIDVIAKMIVDAVGKEMFADRASEGYKSTLTQIGRTRSNVQRNSRQVSALTKAGMFIIYCCVSYAAFFLSLISGVMIDNALDVDLGGQHDVNVSCAMIVIGIPYGVINLVCSMQIGIQIGLARGLFATSTMAALFVPVCFIIGSLTSGSVKGVGVAATPLTPATPSRRRSPPSPAAPAPLHEADHSSHPDR